MPELDDVDPDEVSFSEKDEPTDVPVANRDAQAQADEDQPSEDAAGGLADDDPHNPLSR
jgi:hypothetical protein